MAFLFKVLSHLATVFLLSVFVIPLEDRVEQRAVIKFLVKEGRSPIQCWRRLQQVHGASCMSKNRVRVWHHRYRNGWTETKDQKRSGRPKSVRVPATIQRVQTAINADRRSTMRGLSEDLAISKSSLHNIVRKDLKLSKLAPKFIPKDLTQQQKDTRKEVSQSNIDKIRDDPTLLQRIVTCDESWVSVFEVETKQATSEWHPKGSILEQPRKALRQRSERKSMMTAFFD